MLEMLVVFVGPESLVAALARYLTDNIDWFVEFRPLQLLLVVIHHWSCCDHTLLQCTGLLLTLGKTIAVFLSTKTWVVFDKRAVKIWIFLFDYVLIQSLILFQCFFVIDYLLVKVSKVKLVLFIYLSLNVLFALILLFKSLNTVKKLLLLYLFFHFLLQKSSDSRLYLLYERCERPCIISVVRHPSKIIIITQKIIFITQHFVFGSLTLFPMVSWMIISAVFLLYYYNGKSYTLGNINKASE